MTPRQRMLGAYRGQPVDRTPVAPEFWSYVPARLLGVDMIRFEREVEHWRAMLEAFRHYGCEGWSAIWPAYARPHVDVTEATSTPASDQLDARQTIRTPRGEVTMARRYSHAEPSSATECPIKDPARDWPVWEAFMFDADPAATDWSPVRAALDTVGEDYLLEVALPSQFFDFIGPAREGGLEQAMFDLMDEPAFFEGLHERYLAWAAAMTRAICEHVDAAALFIPCQWSCVSLMGPAMWRTWDLPIVKAMVAEAHRHGRLVHLHHHGRCMDVLEDLVDAGLDCVCPFERPPGGDVTDLAAVRRKLGDHVTMNGNVHTVETLIRGGPDDVAREVESVFEHWGADRRRLIVGTGDQVGRETPDDNLHAMIETAHRLG